MSKKSKQKKRRKGLYTRNEFKNICCEQCMLCAGEPNPTFCYDQMYSTSPRKFINNVLKELIEIKRTVIDEGHDISNNVDRHAIVELILQQAFCEVGVCDNNDIRCADCMITFSDQLENVGLSTTSSNPKKNKKKEKEIREVYEPYPYFFCSPELRQMIDNMFGTIKEDLNGIDNSKQNTAEGSSGDASGDINQSTKDGQP